MKLLEPDRPECSLASLQFQAVGSKHVNDLLEYLGMLVTVFSLTSLSMT
jgi:hypothetical protein